MVKNLRYSSRMIAILATVLGIAGVGIAVLMYTTLPDESAVGEFVAGASVLVMILYALLGMLVLAQVGLLTLLTRHFDSDGWSHRLLTTGVVFGATGAGILLLEWTIVKFRLTPMLHSIIPSEVDYLFILGLVLIPVSIACSVSGVILHGLGSVWAAVQQ